MATHEDEIVKRRVLAKEAGLKKVTRKFLQWSQALDSQSVSETETTYQGLIKELALFEFSAAKVGIVNDTTNRETSQHAQLAEQLKQQMDAVRAEISNLKHELEVERINRKHNEEYDQFAAVVHELPSRDDLYQQMEGVSRELAALDSERITLDSHVELRRKQFGLLMFALSELHHTLSEEPAAATTPHAPQTPFSSAETSDGVTVAATTEDVTMTDA